MSTPIFNKDELLSESNTTFCILPWIHSYIHTDGNVKSCCISNVPIGKLSPTESLEDIWNNNSYKKIRKSMLSGNKLHLNPYCFKCYNLEQFDPEHLSMRKGMNQRFGKYFDEIVKNTNADGSLDTMNFKYMDIRWSNICNFKCRMCTPLFSSLIAAEESTTKVIKQPDVVSVVDQRPNFLDEILPYIDHVESIYFAGGEPLVSEEHYKILTYLVEKNLTHIDLSYNTNLSKLNYNGFDVVELWKKFKHVNVRPSLDSWGPRAEYIRTGTKWTVIENNLERLYAAGSNITVSINTVVSSFNVLTLSDFIEYMIERFKLDENADIKYIMLLYPKQMHVESLPNNLKEIALSKIEAFSLKYPNYKSLNESLMLVKNILTKTPTETYDMGEIKDFINKYDSRRGTKFPSIFPELKDWYYSLWQTR